MPSKIRDYKREYLVSQSSDKEKSRRASRNKARRKALREGRVHKGDGKDIHHPTHDPASSKTQVMSKGKNRSDNGQSKKKK